MMVCDLLRRMPSSEFTEWKAVCNRIEPFGEWRADLRAGMIASRIINQQAGKAVTKPTDWIAEFGPPAQVEPMSDKTLQKLFKGIAGAFQPRKPRSPRTDDVKTAKAQTPEKPPTLRSVASPPPKPPGARKNATQRKARTNSGVVAPRVDPKEPK